MALAKPTLLYAFNGGASLVLVPNVQGYVPVDPTTTGTQLTLSPQSTAGMQSCTYAFQAPGTKLDGQSFTQTVTPFALTLTIAPTPTPMVLTMSVTDGENITSSTFPMQVVMIGTDGRLLATWFGAKGDAGFVSSVVNTGTDDTAALQAMLDFNATATQPASNIRQYACKLPATSHQYAGGVIPARTLFRQTSPIQMNDAGLVLPKNGNTTQLFEGVDGAQSGTVATEYLGPSVIVGVAGGSVPQRVMDPNGSGEWLFPIGPMVSNINTTVAAGSNGQPVSSTTIAVASTAGWATAGQIQYNNALNVFANINYTGISGNTFTGCSVFSGSATAIMATGDTIRMLPMPNWNVSDYSTGDISHSGAFCFEYFYNPCNSAAWIMSNFPSAWTSSMAGCGGLRGDVNHPVQSHETFLHYITNSGTNLIYNFRFQTSAGQVTISSSSSTDQTPPPNKLSHVALTWDGTTVRMFVNGNLLASSALAGNLSSQAPYESFSINSGQNVVWPFIYANNTVTPAPSSLIGRMRLSTVARYTADFHTNVPLPSSIVCDASTQWYMDFQSSSFSARPTMGCYHIAQSGFTPRFGPLPITNGIGFPVWMFNRTASSDYTGGARIRNICLLGYGEGIHCISTTTSNIGSDSLLGFFENAIIFDDFSYDSAVGEGIQYWDCGWGGANPIRSMSAEVFFSRGMQYASVGPRWQSLAGSASWGVVGVFADVTVHTGFPNNYHDGVYAFMQVVGACTIDGGGISDDQAGGFSLCGILLVPTQGQGARLQVRASDIGMVNSGATVPVLLVGTENVPVEFAAFAAAPNGPLVSFRGRAAAGLGLITAPVAIRGAPYNVASIIDASNPGPVTIIEQATFTKSLAFPSDADFTINVANGDAFWGRYDVPASPNLTATRKMTWPANPGNTFTVRSHQATATINLTRTGSASPVALTAGSLLTVRDNGTDLVTV